MTTTMQPTTIKLFLTTGDATGMRTAELSNWTGQAVAGPRTELFALLNRAEVNRPGVYFLLGSDEGGDPLLYIGEAENVRDRLPRHKNKDFWTHAIVFSSKDNNLTKAHIRYLEAALIERAEAIGMATLTNSQGGQSSLPESDRADMQVFMEKMVQLLPILGCSAFNESQAVKDQTTLLCCKGKAQAKGYRTTAGFVVLKGSTATLKTTPSCPAGTLKLREKLVNKEVLAAEEEAYRFTRDTTFSSPSYAASVVRGSSSNGLIEWKTSDGRNLKQTELEE